MVVKNGVVEHMIVEEKGISTTKGEAALALLLGPPATEFAGQTMTVSDPAEFAGVLEKAIAVVSP